MTLVQHSGYSIREIMKKEPREVCMAVFRYPGNKHSPKSDCRATFRKFCVVLSMLVLDLSAYL